MSDTPKCEPPEELRGVDGWHWLTSPFDDEPTIGVWEPDGWWTTRRHDYKADKMAAFGYRYHSPVLTPTKADALRAERDAALADAAESATYRKLTSADFKVASDKVLALRARVAVLEEALKPFAEMAEWFLRLYPCAPEHRTFTEESNFSVANLRRAIAALSTGSKTNEG